MSHNHTPGPWHWAGEGIILNSLQDEIHPGDICDSPGISAENCANARLIAASPDMLEALEQAEVEIVTMLPYLKGNFLANMTGLLSTIRKAMKKAVKVQE